MSASCAEASHCHTQSFLSSKSASVAPPTYSHPKNRPPSQIAGITLVVHGVCEHAKIYLVGSSKHATLPTNALRELPAQLRQTSFFSWSLPVLIGKLKSYESLQFFKTFSLQTFQIRSLLPWKA